MMDQVIMSLVLDSGYLSWVSTMHMAFTCNFAYRASERHRTALKEIKPLIPMMRRNASSMQQCESGGCLCCADRGPVRYPVRRMRPMYPNNFWAPLHQQCTPLQRALMFALFSTLFPSAVFPEELGEDVWLCCVHPDTLFIKTMLFEFPRKSMLADELVFVMSYNQRSQSVKVRVDDRLQPETPRVTTSQLRSLIDLDALLVLKTRMCTPDDWYRLYDADGDCVECQCDSDGDDWFDLDEPHEGGDEEVYQSQGPFVDATAILNAIANYACCPFTRSTKKWH